MIELASEAAELRYRSAEERVVALSPVRSYNEWDPLEEVVVGRLEGATIPSNHLTVSFNIPQRMTKIYKLLAGRRYPRFVVRAAQRELDEFVHILEAEGVTVRRPAVADFSVTYKTPHWRSKGFCAACPRDGLLVVGEEIIEAPMAWRSRYFEMDVYRPLLKEYSARGAKWTAAPRPELVDQLYNHDYRPPAEGEPIPFVVNEYEPVFDAADFVRCGRDLFGIRSNVTNESGIHWLRTHLGDRFRVTLLETRCRQPMHIDSSLMPLAPGKLLVNPDYIDPSSLPPMFASWDILIAPEPNAVPWRIPSMCSRWLSINVLMLDEKRVIVERSQESLIKKLEDWGFEPIPCSFANYAPFGGSFHCATLDVRRRGQLQSYF
jgi:glycine amidinotransferase